MKFRCGPNVKVSRPGDGNSYERQRPWDGTLALSLGINGGDLFDSGTGQLNRIDNRIDDPWVRLLLWIYHRPLSAAMFRKDSGLGWLSVDYEWCWEDDQGTVTVLSPDSPFYNELVPLLLHHRRPLIALSCRWSVGHLDWASSENKANKTNGIRP